MCTFCKCNAETLSHLFWECYYVNEIWESLEIWIKEKFNLDIPITQVDVLLGKEYKYYNVFNIIMCIVKKHIYRKRCKKELPSFYGIKCEIVYYYKCEKCIYSKNNECDKFNQRWNMFPFDTEST